MGAVCTMATKRATRKIINLNMIKSGWWRANGLGGWAPRREPTSAFIHFLSFAAGARSPTLDAFHVRSNPRYIISSSHDFQNRNSTFRFCGTRPLINRDRRRFAPRLLHGHLPPLLPSLAPFTAVAHHAWLFAPSPHPLLCVLRRFRSFALHYPLFSPR